MWWWKIDKTSHFYPQKSFFLLLFLLTEKSAEFISASSPTSHTVTLSCNMSNFICWTHTDFPSSEDVSFGRTNWTAPFHISGANSLSELKPPGVWNERGRKIEQISPRIPSLYPFLWRHSVSFQSSSSFRTLMLSEVRRHLRTRGARLGLGCDLVLISHAQTSFHTWITIVKSTAGQAS